MDAQVSQECTRARRGRCPRRRRWRRRGDRRDHVAAQPATGWPHRHANQARRRDIPGERQFRPLLRHVPQRSQHRRPAVSRQGWHTGRERPLRGSPGAQPERVQPAAAQPRRGTHLRPGPRLHGRAEGARRRPDGQVRPVHRKQRMLGTRGPPAGPGHGLLRRQHRHRAVELRTAVLDERQLLRHHVRPVHAWRAQPGLRPDPRRGRAEQRGPGRARPRRGRLPGRQRDRHRVQRPGPLLRRLLQPQRARCSR